MSKAKMALRISAMSAVGALALGALTVGTVAPAAAASDVTLTIWTFGDVIQPALVREYKTLHPEVTLQIKKSDLDPLNGTNMVTACTAGNGPDIAAVEVSYSGYWRSYPKCFTDLRTLKSTDGAKSATTIRPDYLPWRWEQGVGYDDSVIGIPTDVGGLEVAYRVDLFKKAGLPTDRVKVGKMWPTWDKFINTGRKYMAKLSKAEKKAGKGFMDNSGTIYSAILNQGTEKYYKNDGSDSGQLVYSTNKQVKTAWDTTIKALNAGIGTRIGQFTADWNVGMTKGTFATILAPAWMMDYIKAQAPDTKGLWDIASIPGGGGNQGGTQLTIPASAKNKQAAWDFMTWYLAPEQQLKVFKIYGLFPSTPALYSDPAVLDYKDPFFNNAPVGKIYSTGVKKLKPIFEGKLNRAIDQAFGAGLGRVASKKEKPEAAWASTLAAIKKVVGK